MAYMMHVRGLLCEYPATLKMLRPHLFRSSSSCNQNQRDLGIRTVQLACLIIYFLANGWLSLSGVDLECSSCMKKLKWNGLGCWDALHSSYKFLCNSFINLAAELYLPYVSPQPMLCSEVAAND